jgi:O-antigen/teichoic acid export membrane protein
MKSILQVFSFDLISKAMMGALGVIIIRFMQENEYADYTFALSLVFFITQILSMSFNRIYIVGFHKLDLNDSLAFLGYQLVCIGLLICITAPFQHLMNGVYWFTVALVSATCLSEFSRTILQHELRFLRFSFVELFRSSLFFICVLFLISVVQYKMQAWQVLLCQAGAMFTSFLVFFRARIQIRGNLLVRRALDIALAVIAGKYRYLFGYFSLLALFSQLDVFMLKGLGSNFSLATYGSAFRYYSLLMLSLAAVHSVLLPSIQKVESIEDWDRIHAGLRRMLLVFVPLAFLGAWLSQWIIPWIDKGKYPDAVTVFRILAVSSVFSFAFSPHVNIVLRFEDFKFLFLVIIGGLLLAATLNLLLIPRYQAVGSAIATLVGFGFNNLLIFLRSRKYVINLSRAPA